MFNASVKKRLPLGGAAQHGWKEVAKDMTDASPSHKFTADECAGMFGRILRKKVPTGNHKGAQVKQMELMKDLDKQMDAARQHLIGLGTWDGAAPVRKTKEEKEKEKAEHAKRMPAGYPRGPPGAAGLAASGERVKVEKQQVRYHWERVTRASVPCVSI